MKIFFLLIFFRANFVFLPVPSLEAGDVETESLPVEIIPYQVGLTVKPLEDFLILQQAGPDTGLSFGKVPTEQEITEAWAPNLENDEDYDQWIGVGAERLGGEGATPPDPDQQGGGEQTAGENDEDIFFSRYGRRLTRTKYFGI